MFNFRRIISRGKFIPEIDGLRFIAISSVVLMHLTNYLIVKMDITFSNNSNLFLKYFQKLWSNGGLGVEVFFVISGFILAIPFAKYHLKLGKKVQLKSYFLRRLTRLEPPYIFIMLLLFSGAVLMLPKYSLDELIKSFFSSIFYIHNFVFGRGEVSILNGVTWSLEIEVQFYLLAPFLTYIFAISNYKLRRILMVVSMIFFIFLDSIYKTPFYSLFNFIEYFLIGFLLADLYLSGWKIKTRFLNWALFVICFVLFWLFQLEEIPSHYNFIWALIQNLMLFYFMTFVLISGKVYVMKIPLITNIGGMCYSIYLLHYPIISFAGGYLLKHPIFSNTLLQFVFLFTILLFLVMSVSSIFYLFIERPCMDKNWYKKLLRRG